MREDPPLLGHLGEPLPDGVPLLQDQDVVVKKKIAATSAPWTPASSWGRIIWASLWLAALGLERR
jgi:hypothetical protein